MYHYLYLALVVVVVISVLLWLGGFNWLCLGHWSWPFIGETFEYLSSPHQFVLNRKKRYGDVFSCRVLGEKYVMLTDAESVTWALMGAQRHMEVAYPASIQLILDPTHTNTTPYEHAFVKKTLAACLSPQNLRSHLPSMDALASSLLTQCQPQSLLNMPHQMSRYTLSVALTVICGSDTPGEAEFEEILKNVKLIENGFLSVPISFPFGGYRKALAARDRVFNWLQTVIDRRRTTGSNSNTRNENCFLDTLLLSIASTEGSDGNEEEKVSGCDRFSVMQVKGIFLSSLFAAYETSASQLVWIVKRMHDHPHLHKQLKEEHIAIVKEKPDPSSALSWNDIQKMKLTLEFVYESIRTSHVDLFIPRKALEEVHYKGYIFPAGTKLIANISSVHLSEKEYTQPQNFDPSRFKDGKNPNFYAPFGKGGHSCIGAEFAKLQILVMIHHMVTQYRLEPVSTTNEIQWWPVPIPKDTINCYFSKNK